MDGCIPRIVGVRGDQSVHDFVETSGPKNRVAAVPKKPIFPCVERKLAEVIVRIEACNPFGVEFCERGFLYRTKEARVEFVDIGKSDGPIMPIYLQPLRYSVTLEHSGIHKPEGLEPERLQYGLCNLILTKQRVIERDAAMMGF
jgi:hypothetical protein